MRTSNRSGVSNDFVTVGGGEGLEFLFLKKKKNYRYVGLYFNHGQPSNYELQPIFSEGILIHIICIMPLKLVITRTIIMEMFPTDYNNSS